MNTSKQDERKFFNMYAQIADTMQLQTGAFAISSPDSSPLRALNLCLAPGGYTKILLETCTPRSASPASPSPQALAATRSSSRTLDSTSNTWT